MAFIVELSFSEERFRKQDPSESSAGGVARTRIQLSVSPKRNRDRRRSDLDSRAREVVVSFRSYLMAADEEAVPSSGTLNRAQRILTPWLKKK